MLSSLSLKKTTDDTSRGQRVESCRSRAYHRPRSLQGTRRYLKYEMIAADQAPARPAGPMNARARAVQSLIGALEPGRVAQVEPEGSETVRGTKASISRAAKNAGRTVAVWDSDGAVYVELVEGRPAPRRRGRPPKNR